MPACTVETWRPRSERPRDSIGPWSQFSSRQYDVSSRGALSGTSVHRMVVRRSLIKSTANPRTLRYPALLADALYRPLHTDWTSPSVRPRYFVRSLLPIIISKSAPAGSLLIWISGLSVL